jgi:hypothetical protein
MSATTKSSSRKQDKEFAKPKTRDSSEKIGNHKKRNKARLNKDTILFYNPDIDININTMSKIDLLDDPKTFKKFVIEENIPEYNVDTKVKDATINVPSGDDEADGDAEADEDDADNDDDDDDDVDRNSHFIKLKKR